MLEAINPDIRAISFNGREVLQDGRIFDAALFIVDVRLGEIDGRDLAMEMPQICRSTPFLFISGYPFADDELLQFTNFLTVDFIAKPFSLKILANRVKILLAVSGECRRILFDYDLHESETEHYAFLPFVAVVLDRDLKIHYGNGQLKNLIGIINGSALYASDWLDFIPDDKKDDVRKVHKYIYENIDIVEKEYLECSYPIKKACGRTRLMKWGNTIFQGGPEEEKLILSIATLEAEQSPLMRKNREYWRNQIFLHRVAIKDFRRKMVIERERSRSMAVSKGKNGAA
jgi:CheY-like chemotaxis protein